MTTRLRRALCAVALLLLAIGADVPNANLAASLYYSDAWNHARSYARATVVSKWGLSDEGTALGQSSCVAQLDNRSGAYSPDDARSPLYGLVGRNTPGRVALTPGLTSGALSDTLDAFGRTVSNGWGAADSGETWSLLGSGGSISTANWQVGSGVATMNVPVDTAYRYSYMSAIDVRDVDVAVTFKAPQATGANLEPANILLRGDSDFAYVLARVTLSTGNAVGLAVYARDTTLLGSATVAGLTHAGTGTPLRVRVLAAGARIHMRVWVAASAEPSSWQLVVTDTTEPPQSGWVGVRSGRATGNTNTTNPQFTYDDWESTTYLPIADGAVSKWAPDRDDAYEPSTGLGGDAWTDVEITGPTTRINASKAVWSALRGTIGALIASGDGPEAYWPLEDGPNTLVTQSVIPGIPGMDVYQAVSTITPGIMKFGEGTPSAGSRPIIDLAGGGSLRAYLPNNGTFVDRWAVDWVSTFPLNGQDNDGGNPGSMLTIIFDNTSIGYMQTDAGFTWRMFYGTTAANQGRAVATGSALPTPYDDGLPHHYRIYAVQSGADVNIGLYYDGVLVGTGKDFSDDGLPTTTLGRITEIRVNDSNPEGGSWQSSLGQLVVWYGTPPDMSDVAAGYPGEACADRFLRLCSEHSIPAAVSGSLDLGSHPMGPQQPDTLAELLGEVQRTEMGLIYDGRGWYGVELRTGRSMCNQTAALALTLDQNVAPPIKPVTDDLGITNDVTANAREGTVAHAERSSGPLNTSDPLDDPEGIGRVETQLDVNPETDEQLVDIAGFALHAGTWPGARYETVTVDLTKHPELLADVMAMRPGDLLTIDGLDADTVELLVLGGVHEISSGGYHHRVTFNCVTAGPYAVATVGNTSPFARIGSASSTLAADFDAGSDTSLSVAVTGVLWSTTAPPFNIRVGGVVLHVTAIVGASSPQTFTVDATPVNGITRTLRTTDPAALTKINIERPVYIGY